MVGIDLFSGAGGMSLGAAQAGINVVLAVESDSRAARTYSNNHPQTKVYSHDIRNLSTHMVKDMFKARNGKIVFGGPPCQGFSYSNLRTRSPDNPENWLFLEFVRIACILKPDWVVFENVQGIANTANGIFLNKIVSHIENLGYAVSHGLLNAKDFGVPQDRTRFLLVGSRDGITFKMPRPSYHRPPTIRDAISDLPILENGASVSWMPYRSPPRSTYARKMRGSFERSPNHEMELQSFARDIYLERLKAGVAREQARKDLPLATYTEAYWKIDLHNLLHFLSVRMDQHTQLEIRSYANVIGNEIVSKWCPITWESFLDYQIQGRSFYKYEMVLLKAIAAGGTSEARQVAESLGWLIPGKDGWQANRERKEFEAKATELGVPIPW